MKISTSMFMLLTFLWFMAAPVTAIWLMQKHYEKNGYLVCVNAVNAAKTDQPVYPKTTYIAEE